MAAPATRRRKAVPFFLILSSLSIFSLYYLTSSPPPPHSPLSFYNQISPNPNSPNFTFTIKLLTYNRLHSLSRCLISLSSAHYHHDTVHLHIFIDHFTDPKADSDRKLNESRVILDFVDRFVWKFGEKLVHYRTGNVGLQAQWLEAWWPSSDHDFAFVVEDDLEVSPLYYEFLKGLILKYYYDPSNFHPSIYGASLQRPRFVPGKHGNKIQLDSNTRLFLYQLVGTWGQLLFPRPWKEFRLWYDTQKAQDIKPILDGMVTTGWYKKLGEKIWTPWFIKFIHSRGYFNLYTNFLHERALSISHRDAGVNYGRTAGPDSSLLDKNSLDFNLMEMQPLSKLKWYDFCFRQVIPDKIVRSLNELAPVLHSQQKQKTVIIVNLFRVSEAVTQNLLCHFERLNIRNYILVGPESVLLLDLARRGHPVIDTDLFLKNMQAQKKMDFQDRGMGLIKEMLVIGYSVKKALEVGYNIWVIDGKILPVSGSLFDSTDYVNDFYVGNTFRIFFAKSTSSTKKNWDAYFNKIVSGKNLKDLASSKGRSFLHWVTETLKLEGVNIKNLEKTGFGVGLDSSSIKPLSDGTKMVSWSSEMKLNLIRKNLEELGLWAIDSDLSCTAVVCHGVQ